MSLTINHVLSNEDIARKIFSELDSKTLSKLCSVCKLFNKINIDIGVKINNIFKFDELCLEVFSKFDLETFISCSSVCKLFDSTTNRTELIKKVIPETFALFGNNTKNCLSKHAINSIDEMMMRFKKLIDKTEPLGLFSFKCVFPYNSNNVFFAKRQPALNNGVAIAGIDENYPFDHEDFCVLMKPLTDSNHSAHYLVQFDPYLFQIKTTGVPGEQESQITNGVFSVVEQHDYPRTYLIRKAHRKFIFLPQWQKMLIVGGVAAISLGALAYYTAPRIKQFCSFFDYKQLSLGEQ
jgi:hypothetical protein